jgi:hypothetical protein
VHQSSDEKGGELAVDAVRTESGACASECCCGLRPSRHASPTGSGLAGVRSSAERCEDMLFVEPFRHGSLRRRDRFRRALLEIKGCQSGDWRSRGRLAVAGVSGNIESAQRQMRQRGPSASVGMTTLSAGQKQNLKADPSPTFARGGRPGSG